MARVRKVSARARAGGGRETPIDTSTPTLVPGADQEWFGPGNPLRPVAPPSVAGRRFDFQFGTNINVTPRQSETFSFATLRTLADRHDLTRLAIETCKDRMIRLKWGFRILDSDDDMSPEQTARSDALRKMLRRPDGRNFWVDWLRMVLEDLLVIDAPSIYVRRTMDQSEVVGLVQIDGATIKPIIDAHGNEPDPPYPAFQQVLHGMPAVDYTRDQLLYAPRNRRVHRVYGFSPVEQIVATINIALRRQVWQHSYFTSGNIPDALIGVPSTWTPDQIKNFQDWFDSVLVGNSERRRNGIFVPGEVAKSYVPTKDAEMFGAAEEWLARVVCFCFGIPHQALVKEVNRATADNAYEQAIEDGLAPVMAWVKSLMDRILIDVLGEEELEFWWIKDEAIDPKVQDEIWKGRVDAGSHSRNEWRVAVGDKPRHEPEADRLLYMGKPLGVAEQIEDQKTRMDSGVFPEAVGGDEKSSGDVVASEGKDDAEEDEEASKAASSTTAREGEHCRPFGEERAGDKFSDNGEGLVFETDEGPVSVVWISEGDEGHVTEDDDAEDVQKSAGPDQDSQSLTEEEATLFHMLWPDRVELDDARARLQRTLERALKRQGRLVVAAVRSRLADVSKADEPETVAAEAVALAAVQTEIVTIAIESLGSWDFVIDGVSDALEEAAEDATRQAVAAIGSEDMFDQVSERSVRMAEERAAELVGRRVLADGSIIDNPNPRWAISDSTRDMIRTRIQSVIRNNEGSDALIEALETEHAFSPARAEMIARTEIADINSRAQMETYRVAEEAGVDVRKRWILGPRPCETCIANAAEGAIPLEQPFQSGDDTAPAHPNCVCAVTPEVS